MRVMIIPHSAPPHCMDTEGHLWDLQSMVGGFIEPCAMAQLRERGIELLADEEGLLKGYTPNRNLFPFFFVGNLVAVGVEGDRFVSLTPEQVAFLKEWLKELDELEDY